MLAKCAALFLYSLLYSLLNLLSLYYMYVNIFGKIRKLFFYT